ncbi:ATP-binding cassette domain-containing protein [Streptomyces ficellus]|uniref:ATP-binding cassette domain-containing protein n=1 Tax=Streptomyces ficellus TaxID=1977088 RepID=A0ABT7YZL1_9ACTN|nr:ATP-binding cassette domain-containing protein [Streptomyces ficellus]MDN3292679.1 ATP-binding cassette domain-containing protein [Streptomyces ficellus]
MLQAIGLTSTPRRDRPPAVDDLTFEAQPGSVTALLGATGSGKTTALRMMLELEPGRGVTYFRGRPLHRITHPAREVGVLLGAVPGHPARTARGQLRMLCAAAGVPASRADDMLDIVGLAGLRDQRLGTLSVGMDRRLGIASALLGDPHTLLLDEPAAGLSPRENSWLHGLLRAHADHGGTVLYTTDDPKQAARHADHVVTISEGRLVADQDAAAFARTRLRPRVAVRTPHAARLAAVVTREARAAQRSVEVVTEDGNRLCVYGSDCAEIGETAFRHGVLLHQLADEIGDTGPTPTPLTAPAPAPGSAPTPVTAPTPALAPGSAPAAAPVTAAQATGAPVPAQESRPAPGSRPEPLPEPGPAPLPRKPLRSPLRPLRYELHRMLGVPTTHMIAVAALATSLALAVFLGRSGSTPLPTALAAWPGLLPLPPAALGAGLLGALSFGDEYRYPAHSSGRGTVPRRLGLLLAKLTVTAVAALLLALLVAAVDLGALRLVYGGDVIPVPRNWPSMCASWAGLSVGCAWAGLLAAGVFRATAAGVAAVLAVPVVIAPLVQTAVVGPSVRSIAGLPSRLRELAWAQWPHESDRWLLAVARVVAQPVATALVLSLTALVCAYLFTGLRRRARW